MRVIALLAAYNEERFIAGCLDHYLKQGVEVYLIDNGSTDRTVAIAEQYLNRGLIAIEHWPRDGVYRWGPILIRKEELALTLEADWFMHADPDEIRLPPNPNWTLTQAFEYIDQQGFNAVNFMEFTFIPVREAPDHDHPNFQQTMRWYYPFLPSFPHQLKAWKRQPQRVSLTSAGHLVSFAGLRLYPNSLPMQHYQFLSVEQATIKYGRKHAPEELQKGWHNWREPFSSTVQLPSKAELREYWSDGVFDASNPRTRHYLDIASEQSKNASQNSPMATAEPTNAEKTITALRFQVDLFNRHINALGTRLAAQEAQLKSTQLIAEVASREVESLHRSKFFRIAERYWHWSANVKNTLGRLLKSDRGNDHLAKQALQLPSPTVNNATPRVTVAIPYFKCRDHVRRAVESILNQTYTNLLVLVVNDGDDDPPWNELSDIDDPRLVRFNLQSNQGVYFVRQVVLTATPDTYFLVQDADDTSEPDRIEKLFSTITKDESQAATSAVRVFPPPGSQQVSIIRDWYSDPMLPLTKTMTHRLAYYGLFETQALRDIGGFFGGFRVSYDQFLMSILQMTCKVSFINEPLYIYYRYLESLTLDLNTGPNSRLRRETLQELQRLYEEAFNRYSDYLLGQMDRAALLESIQRLSRTNVSSEQNRQLEIEVQRLRTTLGAHARQLVPV